MGEGPKGVRTSRRQALRREVQHRHDRFYRHCAHWSFAGDGSAPAQPMRWHREHWILAATAALMVLLSALAMPSWASAMKPTIPRPHTILALTLPPLPPQPAKATPPPWQIVKVQAGQTLSAIFQAHGLGFSDLKRALDATTDSSVLRNIHPGDTFALRLGPQGKLEALRFDADDTHRVTLHFTPAGVTRTVKESAFGLREHIAHGVITHSLSAAAAKAGLSNAVMVELSHIFRNEINFRRDIRTGARFTVIYNGVYRDGIYVHAGNILAAEFENNGHRYTAYRYTLPNGHWGYYDQNGRPLSVSLLRTPVKYTRISSRFGWRMDPVLHSRHLHTGVDLAAPKGTPIHAASRGVITVHRWVHGYGRYICIKLNSKYSTCYAHMSAYVKGLHDGTHVHQGEVIGYVGMTGFATGPHLHFEVRVHGKPVNPLTVTLPKPKPLSPALLAKFERHTQPLLATIERLDTYLAVAKAYARNEQAHGSHAG